MSSDDYNDHAKHEDMKVLHGMGYAQELSRSMSKFSNFAISFSIICILSGGINSFPQAIGAVGGAALGGVAGAVITNGGVLGTVGGAALGGIIGDQVSK